MSRKNLIVDHNYVIPSRVNHNNSIIYTTQFYIVHMGAAILDRSMVGGLGE